MDDPNSSQHLIQIARNHVKLALEHSKAHASQQRRQAITEEIRRLRIERYTLLQLVATSAPKQ